MAVSGLAVCRWALAASALVKAMRHLIKVLETVGPDGSRGSVFNLHFCISKKTALYTLSIVPLLGGINYNQAVEVMFGIADMLELRTHFLVGNTDK